LRKRVTLARAFINAFGVDVIIFVRGVTEDINVVASSFGLSFIGDDERMFPLRTSFKYYPWQWVCDKRNAKLKVIPINNECELNIDQFARMPIPHTRIVAVSHASNSLGTINLLKR
jgi:cysteine desulfurase/selenocysteine lyase